MTIETICVTPFQQNARLIIDDESLDAAVVDPGGDVPLILQTIKKHDVSVKAIILTHSHIDHVGGVTALLKALSEADPFVSPKLFAHRAEADFRSSVSQQALYFGLSPEEFLNAPEPDVYVEDGSEILIGNLVAKILFTPGHSPGHVAIFFDGESIKKTSSPRNPNAKTPVLISGDALFAGSIGRTDLPGGNYFQLLESIKHKLLTLPGETIVKSGHGPDTTIERERRTNPFLLNS